MIRRRGARAMGWGAAALAACCFGAGCRTAPRAEPELVLYLFAGSSCPECRVLKEDVFPRVLPAYGGLVEYRHVAVDNAETFKLLRLYERACGDTSPAPVKLFIGRQCLAGLETIRRRLGPVIDEELLQGHRTPAPDEVRRAAAEAPAP